MSELWKLIRFVKPYWQKSLRSMVLLIAVVIMDLAIPRLVQRIIDEGINQQNMDVVVQTSLVMFAISIFNMALAIGNNNFSVQVGESVARDLREALFLGTDRARLMARFADPAVKVVTTQGTYASIMLYAFGEPFFVVDAYTIRVFSRIGLIVPGERYENVRAFFEGNLPADVGIFQEYHALVVKVAKEFCRRKPLCDGCPLYPLCGRELA